MSKRPDQVVNLKRISQWLGPICKLGTHLLTLCRKKKLSTLNNSYKSEFNSGFKNAIVDFNVLAGVFSEAVKCLQCGATGLNLPCEEKCSGGAVELGIICEFCSYSYKFCSSKKFKAENGKLSTYEVNTRLVYAMRYIGKVQKLHECFAES
ncbi:hypothetical protein TNCV_4742501 [Trichonephila clavipes]|nr:hypothetical protein TNCV_4742501 [Trichonephila clavipes]